MPIASEVSARVVSRAGAGVSLARGHFRTALARVPDGPGVAASRSCCRIVVEAVRLAGVVEAAWPGRENCYFNRVKTTAKSPQDPQQEGRAGWLGSL